jgi:DNA polymerase-1
MWHLKADKNLKLSAGVYSRKISDRDCPLPQAGYLYGMDVETTAIDDLGPFSPNLKIRLLQLGSEEEAWIFDMENDEERAWIRKFLADNSNSFTSYTDYDNQCVYTQLAVDISDRNLDCRILTTLASPDDHLGGKDLKTATVKYLRTTMLVQAEVVLHNRFEEIFKAAHPHVKRPLKKDITVYGWNNIPKNDMHYLIYAGLDAIAARRLVPVLLRASRAPWSLVSAEIWLDQQSVAMRRRGMMVNDPKADEMYDESKKKVDYHLGEFSKIVTEPVLRGRGAARSPVDVPISPRSGRKITAWLYAHGADFTTWPLTKAGQKQKQVVEKLGAQLDPYDLMSGKWASLDKTVYPLFVLLKLDDVGRAAVRHLLGFKQNVYTVTKIEEIRKATCDDERIRPVLRTLGAVTGRSTSSAPNVQNYPRSSDGPRKVMRAAPGKVLISVDFSQVEPRVAAGLSQDASLIDIFNTGRKLYNEVSAATGVGYDEAKVVLLASLYGAGAKTIAKQTGLEVEEAKFAVRNFWTAFPQLDGYRQTLMNHFTDEIRTVSNRRIPVARRFETMEVYNRVTGEMEEYQTEEPLSYKNLNTQAQSAARELAMSAWYRFANTTGVVPCVWAFVHDELVLEVNEDQAEWYFEALSQAMTMTFRGVPIVAAGKIFQPDEHGVSSWGK